jgi:hypothetical protein
MKMTEEPDHDRRCGEKPAMVGAALGATPLIIAAVGVV